MTHATSMRWRRGRERTAAPVPTLEDIGFAPTNLAS
jgi:hypothetical protein